jgi:hypothetical protein
MAEPSGHTLLSQALRTVNRAIQANRDAPPWREIVARTSAPTQLSFGVAIYEGDPEHVVDRYSIRAHEGRFEVVEHGRFEPAADWRVSVDHLRSLVARPERFVEAPEKLDLGWLEERLAIRRRKKRPAGWRIGRARRPRR